MSTTTNKEIFGIARNSTNDIAEVDEQILKAINTCNDIVEIQMMQTAEKINEFGNRSAVATDRSELLEDLENTCREVATIALHTEEIIEVKNKLVFFRAGRLASIEESKEQLK